VRVPVSVRKEEEGEGGSSEESWSEGEIASADVGKVVDYMQATFVREFDTFIAMYAYKGRLWTRLSGQVYLEMKDWEWCGEVVKEVCGRVRRGEYKEDGNGMKSGAEIESENGEVERSGPKAEDVVEAITGEIERFSVDAN
jgi:hypothetical protein